MPIIFRWLFYGCLGRTAGTLLALLSVFVIVETFDKARYLGHGMDGGMLVEYVLLKMPFMVSEFMPVILLLAVSIYITELSRHNELVILRASGLGMNKLLFPVLAVSMLAAILSFIIGEWVTPVTNARLDYIENANIHHRVEARHDVQWLKDGNRFFRLTPLGNDVFKLTMLATDGAGHWRRSIEAARAQYSDGRWYLLDVFISEPGEGGLSVHHEETLDLGAGIGPHTADPPKPRHMRFDELWRYVESLKQAGLSSASYQFSLHRKLAAPLACAIMVLLALALCAQLSHRLGRQSMGLLAAIGLGLAFYIMGNATGLLSRGERLPAAFAAWLPNMVFAGLAGFLLLRREGH